MLQQIELQPRHIVARTQEHLPTGGMFELLQCVYRPLRVFETARGDWTDSFQMGRAAEQMSNLLTAGNLTDPGVRAKYKEDLAWLSRLRKRGTRLVDMWKMLDAGHKPPKLLKKVIRNIGRFKDAVWSNGLIEYNPAKLHRQIEELRACPEYKPAFATFLGFYEYYQSRLQEVAALMEQDSVSLEEHHTVRKTMRAFRHLFELAGRATGNEDATRVAAFLNPVSVEMGKVQIQIVMREASGEADPETDRIVIGREHRAMIMEFLAAHPQL